MRVWLIQLRKAQGIKVKDVARAADISPQAYWYIEVGERNPSVCTAKKIAAVLGFEWVKFFE